MLLRFFPNRASGEEGVLCEEYTANKNVTKKKEVVTFEQKYQ